MRDLRIGRTLDDIQPWHQGEYAYGKKDGRSKRPQEAHAGPKPNDEVDAHKSPHGEGRGFIQIRDGAAIQAHSALEHGRGVEDETQQQQQIANTAVLAESFSPEENRMNHANTVCYYGEQEEMPVSEPIHKCQVNRPDKVRKPELGDQAPCEGSDLTNHLPPKPMVRRM